MPLASCLMGLIRFFLVGSTPFQWALGDFLGPWAHLGGSFCRRDVSINPAGSIETFWLAFLAPGGSRGFLLGLSWGSLGLLGVLLVASLGYL